MRTTKTKHPHRTKTRAAIDRCVFDIYYELVDRDHVVLSEIMDRHKLGWPIVKDLRELGYIVSTGKGRGQTHCWTGAPPTDLTGDQIEKLRARRQRDLRKRQLERQRQDKQETKAETTPPPAVKLPENPFEEYSTDQLLDFRSLVDKAIKIKNQPRLF